MWGGGGVGGWGARRGESVTGGRGAGRVRRVMGVVGAASRGRRAGAVRAVRVVGAAAAATAAAEDVGRRRRWRLGSEAGRVGYRWQIGRAHV